MSINKLLKNSVLWLMWFFEGIVIGFGAILPGISGGMLCVAFGMYRPIIDTLSNVKTGLKKYGLMLVIFAAGVGVGFVGLSGLAAILMEKNTVIVTCAFIGFIVGTIPELWHDAGSKGRTKWSYFALIIAFVAMFAILLLLKTTISVTVSPDIPGFLLCGLLWGLSFIIPGLSSSSLLLFFGLYQPMLKGISSFNLYVLIPMGIGMVACVLLLSKLIGYLYKKHYNIISHCVVGIILATAVMILPPVPDGSFSKIALNILAIVGGGVVAYFFTYLCDRLKTKADKE